MPKRFESTAHRVGKSYADRQNEVVLTVGEFKLTRRQVNKRLECGYTPAVHRLNKVVKRNYSQYKTVAAMAKAVKCWDLKAHKHVGDVTIYAFMCVIELTKQNPNTWLDSDYTIATTCRRGKKARKKRQKK